MGIDRMKSEVINEGGTLAGSRLRSDTMSSSRARLWLIIISTWERTLSSVAAGLWVANTSAHPGLRPNLAYSVSALVAALSCPLGSIRCASSMRSHVTGSIPSMDICIPKPLASSRFDAWIRPSSIFRARIPTMSARLSLSILG